MRWKASRKGNEMSDLLKINVNDWLEYEPETGNFYWRVKRGRQAAKSRAGSVKDRGYISIFFDGHRHYAHRLAVLAMTGAMPDGVVDHIDGDTGNNRWENLRVVSQSENMENRRFRAQANSKSGLIGASPHANGGFVAQITRGGRHRYLGYFKTADEAHTAYKEANHVCR
jgi:hypothetical protein